MNKWIRSALDVWGGKRYYYPGVLQRHDIKEFGLTPRFEQNIKNIANNHGGARFHRVESGHKLPYGYILTDRESNIIQKFFTYPNRRLSEEGVEKYAEKLKFGVI